MAMQKCIMLTKITKWVFQWKMSFNPDISKQSREVIFPRKRSIASHPPLIFINIRVAYTNCPKHLRMQLDKKLNFGDHLKKDESTINKTIKKIKLKNVLP